MNPSNRLCQIITRKCFLDLIKALNNKIDPKELVEVECMFNIVRKEMKVIKEDVLFFDIGCGKRPTLATYLALNYPYNVIAIDPQLDLKLAKNIKRIALIKSRLVNWNTKTDKLVIVCANHSHHTQKEIKSFLSRFNRWIYITCPCCIDNILDNIKGEFIIDKYNWSPKNKYYIFKKLI